MGRHKTEYLPAGWWHYLGGPGVISIALARTLPPAPYKNIFSPIYQLYGNMPGPDLCNLFSGSVRAVWAISRYIRRQTNTAREIDDTGRRSAETGPQTYRDTQTHTHAQWRQAGHSSHISPLSPAFIVKISPQPSAHNLKSHLFNLSFPSVWLYY